jgi:hypothetical protein
VTFSLFNGDATCSDATKLVAGFPITVNLVNGVATTPTTTLKDNGTYYWLASYSGDDNNLPSSSTCGNSGELTTISGNTPGIDP